MPTLETLCQMTGKVCLHINFFTLQNILGKKALIYTYTSNSLPKGVQYRSQGVKQE